MGLGTGIDVSAPADLVWDELVDLDRWPGWGPSVRSARLDDGTRRLRAGATGSVQTAVGLWLPFEVSAWEESPDRRSWAWRVRGVRATSHTVRGTGPATCRLDMGVPLWAPGYLGVVAIGLRRIRARAQERAGSDG
jgi:hypothetical protein